MKMHLTRCKLSKNTQAKLVEYFVLEVTARSAADLLGIQPNSAALYYCKLRELITYHLDAQAEEFLGGEIELDERYFGGHRKGKRGRGAAGKMVVFGIRIHDNTKRPHSALGYRPPAPETTISLDMRPVMH